MGFFSFLGEVVNDWMRSNMTQIQRDVLELEEMLDKEIKGDLGEFKDSTRDMYVKYIERYARRIPREGMDSDDRYRLGTYLCHSVEKLDSLCKKAGLEFDAQSLSIEIRKISGR